MDGLGRNSFRAAQPETATSAPPLAPGLSSPFFLDGWLEFNRVKWGVTPQRLTLGEPRRHVPRLDTVLYLDSRGRVTLPLLNAHLPVAFTTTESSLPARIVRQRQVLAGQLAEEYLARGLHGGLCLSPEVADVREWQWRGFRVEVLYTFHLPLPLDESRVSHSVRKNIRKATGAGFACALADLGDISGVWSCIESTEKRQGFTHGLTRDDLANVMRLMGHAHIRAYVCRNRGGGDIVAFRVALVGNGTVAIDWIACVEEDYLGSGAVQQLLAYQLDDLASLGVTLFDVGGANLRSVSAAKLDWGGLLIPYFRICRPIPDNVYTKARRRVGGLLRGLGLR